ncbi:hypothetical protein APS56_05740 [Pseudalgibacter alginicilyticus]|uniref:Glycosyltransferase 2-like domain-containing protein n=1 Tax=Pseudalgibacter alginicilyticus TaxID=1736674 RepID=A0A0P0D7F9_9FLAO|nr:glycosyltransferase family 2 protein [Pseudalgibacter alginicilyticus]ALJ04664.1 hypothetical protein APS56_05740 [Pseudalgibacter alginicilyticus]
MIPFFSIIIPLYNKESYIYNTLLSIINQTHTDFEVIVIDDGSTDESFNIASKIKDPRIHVFQQKNKGAAITRNNGIEMSTGKFIALLDADDLWHPNHLKELQKQINLFPDAGLYCNNYEVKHHNEFTKPASFNFEYKQECLIIEDFFRANIINFIATSSSVAFLKSSFKTIGGYNPEFEIAEDLDLWVRFALKYKISFNPIITMAYNFHVNNSLSKQEINEIRYRFINHYYKEEKENPSLKLYMDINRYALGLRCKLNKEKSIYKKVKLEIDYKNLNWKQRILLNSPIFLLKLARQFQQFSIKNNIYFSAFK